MADPTLDARARDVLADQLGLMDVYLAEYVSLKADDALAAMLAFAAEAVAREREACAAECEQRADDFLSPQYAIGQPMSSFSERFACVSCAAAIRQRTVSEGEG